MVLSSGVDFTTFLLAFENRKKNGFRAKLYPSQFSTTFELCISIEWISKFALYVSRGAGENVWLDASEADASGRRRSFIILCKKNSYDWVNLWNLFGVHCALKYTWVVSSTRGFNLENACTQVTLTLACVLIWKHSYYDKRGQIMGLRLRSPCNLDAGKCQKDNSSATPRSYCRHELSSSLTVISC